MTADRAGRLALALLALSIGLFAGTGLLGPSAAEPPLPQRAPHPPYWLDAHPPAELVTALLLAAVVAGAAGMLVGLRAVARGWHPQARRLAAASLVALAAVVAVPPMGSADHLVYAAYGRIAATGGDPYTDTARDLAATGDPVGRAVEAPWQDVPSVYGPVATAVQEWASRLAGPSTHSTVFLLVLVGAAAFVTTGSLLRRLVRGDPAAETRVLLLWSLNPLLLYLVVGAGHVDGFGVVWAVAALAALRRSPAAAGALVGVACAVKLSLGLYVLALAWGLRRDRRSLAEMLAGAVAVGALTYGPVGLHALDQVRESTRYVSFASPWRLTVGPLEAVLDDDVARRLIGLAGAVALVLLARLLWRALPAAAVRPGVRSDAVRAAAALTLGWVLTAPYSLPWYDVAAWAPVAVLSASAYDTLLVVRTSVLAAAYLPGRVVELPSGLDVVTRNLRGTVAPIVGVLLVAAVVRTARDGSRRTPRAPAVRRS